MTRPVPGVPSSQSVSRKSADDVLASRVRHFLDVLSGPTARPRSLRITVLSWDTTTCFRAMEALRGRHRKPPSDVESQNRFHMMHEMMPLADDLAVEILAIRADAFEPAFVAPLVHDCHLFLLFSDVDAGHLSAHERPLAERVNELRNMFRGASAAGRITLGGGAVTDPGTDMLLPELARYLSWDDLPRQSFLSSLLAEVGRLLGIDFDGE